MTKQGWKVFTHDWRSPIQGGEPVCDGQLPVDLPSVELDTGPEECAAGWNFCADLATAARIGGLWPTGRPSIGVLVTPSADAITRGAKRRSSGLRLERRATEAEWLEAITALSVPLGVHQERMVSEQMAWRQALARPAHDAKAVEQGLQAALDARGLNWKLRRFQASRDAWADRAAGDAWDTWADRAAGDAWDAWDTRDARDAWAAWATRDATRDARDAWAAWATRDATRDARDAWAAWAARIALTVTVASLMGWVKFPPALLTTGLRDAYRSGLELALPTGPDELGWVMAEA